MILSAADFLTDEMIIKKLPFLTPEEAEEVLQQREQEQLEQYEGENVEEPEDGEEGEGDDVSGAIDEAFGGDDDEVTAMLDDFEKEIDSLFSGSGDEKEDEE